MATRRTTRIDISKLTDEELRNPDFVKTKFAELNGAVDARDAEISRHTGAIAALQADIVAVRTDAALKDSLLTQKNQDISLRETRNAEDMVNSVFDSSKAIECRWKLYKLSKRTGEPQWEWFQTRHPLHVESDGRTVGVLFADELQVIKSIAL